MKVVGSFNKISEKLRKELIPVVKQNEVINFQLLNGSYEPSIGREAFGSSRSIRLSDRVFDPYQKDEKGEEVGAYVDIGVPEVIKEGRVEQCKIHWVNSIAVGIPGNGQFQLMGGNVNDMEVLEFLCLSNGNKNNPYRDKSKDAVYEIVNAAAIRAKEKEKDFKELKARLTRFAKDNPEQAAELSTLIPEKKKEPVT